MPTDENPANDTTKLCENGEVPLDKMAESIMSGTVACKGKYVIDRRAIEPETSP